MTNQATLTKAITVAIKKGWKAEPLGGAEMWPELSDLEQKHVIALMLKGQDDVAEPYKIVIFNHDFAKALWGEELVHGFKGNILAQVNQFHQPAWMFHLQNMVVEENPIKYLGDHI